MAFVPSFADVTAFATDDGLVLVDMGSSFTGAASADWAGRQVSRGPGWPTG